MVLFERVCLSGPSFRNPSAGSWCVTSNRSATLPRPLGLPLRNLDSRILVRSSGRIVENHCQAHARFREARFGGSSRVALINLADGKMLFEHALAHMVVLGAAFQFQ